MTQTPPMQDIQSVGGALRTPSEQGTEPVETKHQSYYMTDKGGYMARWKNLRQAMTLQATDFKDPPTILFPVK